MKHVFWHGVLAGIASSVAAVIYSKVYYYVLGVDFSKVINQGSITGLNVMVCLFFSLLFFFFNPGNKNSRNVWFNIIFTLLTFGSIIIPIYISLPLDIKEPELFLGLTIPMLLFPQLFWLSVKPLIGWEEG